MHSGSWAVSRPTSGAPSLPASALTSPVAHLSHGSPVAPSVGASEPWRWQMDSTRGSTRDILG